MKKFYYTIERVFGNRWFPLLFIPIAICFLLLYSFSTSPLFLNEGMDSAVFKTMGLAILKGKVPYVDIFDHKGPILYFINALGQWLIPGRMGVFILQVIGLSVAMVYMFKIARLFVGYALSFLVVLFTLFIYGGVIQEGNQCEEWMMYFFVIAIYYALYYFVKQSNRDYQVKFGFLYGFCFGITFFIRPNDAVAMIGGLMIGLTIWLIYKKEYKRSIFNALTFVMGYLLVAIPVFSYFAYYHAVGDMWYGLAGFNNSYSGGFMHLFLSVFGKRKLSLLLVLIMLGIMVYACKNNKAIIVVAPMMALELLLLGSAFYNHYYIVFIPLFVVYFAVMFRQNKSMMLLAVAVFCCTMQGYNLVSFCKLARKECRWRVDMLKDEKVCIGSFYKESERLLSNVPDDEKNDIWNYNLGWNGRKSAFSILYHEGIVQCNLITIGRDDRLQERDNLSEKMPLWVVVEGQGFENQYIETNNDKVIQNRYELIAVTDTTICNLKLYRRKY